MPLLVIEKQVNKYLVLKKVGSNFELTINDCYTQAMRNSHNMKL